MYCLGYTLLESSALDMDIIPTVKSQQKSENGPSLSIWKFEYLDLLTFCYQLMIELGNIN